MTQQDQRWQRANGAGAPALLRAPPFPGARPAGGPRPRSTPYPAEDIARLATAIAAARVGGDFWSAADPWQVLDGRSAVHAAPDSELALLAAAAGIAVDAPGSGERVPRAALLDRLAAAIGALDYRDPFTGAPILPFSMR